MIGVAVGEQDGVELRDADAEGLVAKIGRGVDDDVFVVIAKPDGGAKAIIAGIGGSADVAIAADGGNADAGTGAEDGEGGQAHFGSWDSGLGISDYFSKVPRNGEIYADLGRSQLGSCAHSIRRTRRLLYMYLDMTLHSCPKQHLLDIT